MAEPAPTDLELLHSHAAGTSPDAFAELVARHRDRCWSLALRMLADREDAADAVQEAFLSAHRAAGTFRGDSAVGTWLHRIVTNACLDRLRKRGALPTVPLDEERDDTAEPVAGSTEQRLDLEAALRALPADQRVILLLCAVEDRPVREVAELLGIPEGTVKSRAARGRARLAELLADRNQMPAARVEPPVSDPSGGAA